jgi:hypothetical protein
MSDEDEVSVFYEVCYQAPDGGGRESPVELAHDVVLEWRMAQVVFIIVFALLVAVATLIDTPPALTRGVIGDIVGRGGR